MAGRQGCPLPASGAGPAQAAEAAQAAAQGTAEAAAQAAARGTAEAAAQAAARGTAQAAAGSRKRAATTAAGRKKRAAAAADAGWSSDGELLDGIALDARERVLRQRFALDAAQLRWRRWCIDANCGGDEDLFCQEYPADAEEAFLSSGRPVFAVRALQQALAGACAPRRGRLAESSGAVRFCEGEGEYLSLYQPPQPGADYVVGIDVAAGLRGGDYSCMAVLEKRRLELVALWHGHLEPDLLAQEAALLGRYYGRALLVPEANNHGIAVLSGLRRLHYGHVFRRSNGESGFLTTARSKAELVAALAAYLREDAGRVHDAATLQECLTFIYDEKGHANARSGCHDDRVIALALAVWQAGQGGNGPRIREADWRAVYGADETTGY